MSEILKNRSLPIWPSVYPLLYTALPNANTLKSIWKPSKKTSHIVDYYGNVMSYSASGYNTMAAAILDIEALRQFRVMNLNSNWMKDLRTEVFKWGMCVPKHPPQKRGCAISCRRDRPDLPQRVLRLFDRKRHLTRSSAVQHQHIGLYLSDIGFDLLVVFKSLFSGQVIV